MSTEYLVLCNSKRHCARCRAETFWATEGQLAGRYGLCLDHARDHPCRDAPQDLREATRNLLATFPRLDRIGAATRPLKASRWASWRWVVAGTTWRSHHQGSEESS